MSENGLSDAVYGAIVKNGGVASVVSWRLADLKGACAALSLSVFESNVKSNGEVADNNVAHFLAMVENELGLIESLVEHGLEDRKKKRI